MSLQAVFLPDDSKGQPTEAGRETKAYGWIEMEKPFRKGTCLLFLWLCGCLWGWSKPVGAYSAGPPSSSSLSSVARFRMLPTSLGRASKATRAGCFPTSAVDNNCPLTFSQGQNRSRKKFVLSKGMGYAAGSAQTPRRQDQQLARDHLGQVATCNVPE